MPIMVLMLVQIIAVKNIWQEGLCASTYQGTWMKASEPDLIFVRYSYVTICLLLTNFYLDH